MCLRGCAYGTKKPSANPDALLPARADAVVPITWRIRWLPVSATYTVPSAATATPWGEVNLASWVPDDRRCGPAAPA